MTDSERLERLERVQAAIIKWILTEAPLGKSWAEREHRRERLRAAIDAAMREEG